MAKPKLNRWKTEERICDLVVELIDELRLGDVEPFNDLRSQSYFYDPHYLGGPCAVVYDPAAAAKAGRTRLKPLLDQVGASSTPRAIEVHAELLSTFSTLEAVRG
ncbi:hypothetical protein [Burkholderia pseudomallei]|uniref:hypothetical protein n=1 Tax=Burkholderia pseudomallei TaxID=28450 RepID=UPI0012B87EF5|nr:hypothetical protein [Burkholderia pseudomallei]